MIIETKDHGSIDLTTKHYIGEGHEVYVYKIDDNKVIKVSKTRPIDTQCAEKCINSDSELIPKVYEVNSNEGYYIMHYVEGIMIRDVTHYVNRGRWINKGFTPSHFKDIFFDIDEFENNINKLKRYSNKVGIIPNDLHDQNVMLTPEGKIWIVDLTNFINVSLEYHSLHSGDYGTLRRYKKIISEFVEKIKIESDLQTRKFRRY